MLASVKINTIFRRVVDINTEETLPPLVADWNVYGLTTVCFPNGFTPTLPNGFQLFEPV